MQLIQKSTQMFIFLKCIPSSGCMKSSPPPPPPPAPNTPEHLTQRLNIDFQGKETVLLGKMVYWTGEPSSEPRTCHSITRWGRQNKKLTVFFTKSKINRRSSVVRKAHWKVFLIAEPETIWTPSKPSHQRTKEKSQINTGRRDRSSLQ